MTYFQTILAEIENNQNFANEVSGWFTLNNQKENRRIVVTNANGENLIFTTYKNNSSFAKRVKYLLNH